ncbi:MAG TPA: FAD binding domain-containing protein [Syntrophorhabdaceae bacterium]
MTGCEYYKPQTLKEALDLAGSLENWAYIAGGTDVMVLMRQKKIRPAHLISLRNVGAICAVDTGSGLTLGSGVTMSEINGNETIRKRYSALVDATSNVGSKQIRNVATVGGNICNAAPSADSACPLLVLDAGVCIMGPGGERVTAIDDFLVGPNKVAMEKGEIVTSFKIPALGANTGSAYIKHTRRQAMDLPILGIAARITIRIDGDEVGCKDAFCTIDSISHIVTRLEEEKVICEDVRIAMGVVAPRPIRAKKAEEALRGKVISEALFREIGEIAASESQPRDSVRGEAWYRRDMVKVLTKRAILKAIDRVVRPDDVIFPERLW